MLLKGFFNTISDLLPVGALVNLEALSELDPHRMSIENVHRVLRVPRVIAQKICDIGVRQGVLKRMVAVVCPLGEDGAEAENESDLPEMVTCTSEEGGFPHDVDIPASQLRKVTFYRLANG